MKPQEAAATSVVMNKSYRTLNRALTLLGVDRRLFFMAAGLGVASFNLFRSLLGGLMMFALLYGFGLWTTKRDPALLSVLLRSMGQRSLYDPMKSDDTRLT